MADDPSPIPGRAKARQQMERLAGTDPKPPTRFALALRRQSANRARKAAGQGLLPPIGPGKCPACDGWGVQGPSRHRCKRCGGSGG